VNPAQLDKIITLAFPPDYNDNFHFEEGLCFTFALGIERFMALFHPKVETRVLVGYKKNGTMANYSHCVVEIPECKESFDWKGRGAVKRWNKESSSKLVWKALRKGSTFIAGATKNGDGERFRTDPEMVARCLEAELNQGKYLNLFCCASRKTIAELHSKGAPDSMVLYPTPWDALVYGWDMLEDQAPLGLAHLLLDAKRVQSGPRGSFVHQGALPTKRVVFSEFCRATMLPMAKPQPLGLFLALQKRFPQINITSFFDKPKINSERDALMLDEFTSGRSKGIMTM
jgi:hypothetical protein